MEVVPAMGDSSPFQRRDVTEWSHMDRLTGMMETARVETDRWAASTPTSAHSYGKVVDSRNRSLPDGSAQQRQRQQLEVFQTKGPGGSLQVIRTQSVTSSNSSWRGTSSSRAPLPAITQDFGNLQLTLNPLDLSSEKSKGSVGRSGSIGGRRPPSRPRSLVGKLVAPLAIEEDDVNSRLAQVSRICQQVHDDAAFKANERASKNIASLRELTSSTSSRSGSDSFSNGHLSISRKKSTSIEDLHNGEDLEDVDEGFRRSSKVRRSLQFPLKKLESRGGVSKFLQDLEESNKRNASEGRIARKSFEALENVLKRGNNKFDSLNKDSEDSESSHTGNDEYGSVNSKHVVNNVSLDSFSKKFNRFSLDKRHSFIDPSDSKDELESSNDESKSKSPVTKRHSFVTVESLKEVRGRLKRLNSPLDGLDTESGMDETEDNDDGIGTDESAKRIEQVDDVPQSRVKSYVYGMEGLSTSSRPPVVGTGSLESRTSSKSNSNGSRSDEWYNRRKSYGFEKVTAEQTNDSSSTLSSKGDDSKLESTDSGICRSSEAFNVPSWSRKVQSSLWNKAGESDVLSVSHSIQIKPKSSEDGEEKESVDKRKTTVVSFGGKNDPSDKETTNNKVADVIRRNFSSAKMLSASLVNGVRTEDSEEKGRNRHVTVSIPIVQEDSSPTVGSRRLFYQQLAQGTTLSVEKSSKKSVRTPDESPPSLLALRLGGDDWWMKPNRALRDFSPESKLGGEDWRVPSKLLSSAMKRHSFAGENSWKNLNGTENFNEIALQGPSGGDESWRRAIKQSDTEMKRHSIAVDELKYVQDEAPSSMTVAFAHDVDSSILKKHKKVEFCKTEVHFAAEPGRFNIVETDEKPPSTNMFRRRRRLTNPTPEALRGTNLPEVRFGDSIYEKQLLGGNEDASAVAILKTPVRPTTLRLSVQEDTFQDTDDHVFTQANATIRPNQEEEEENDDQDNAEFALDSKPRSILKNFSKPQPYHLGQGDNSPSPLDDEHDEKWGVRLRPVARDSAPVWKSTVTVSSRDAVMPVEYSGQSELQKLLRSLRPANQRKHDMLLAARYSGTTKTPVSDWSVAERVRHVEQVSSETKGFSTRVNFGGGEARVLEEQQPAESVSNQRLFQSSDRPKPIWQRREEAIMASGYSVSEPAEMAVEPKLSHSSVATAVLPNYGESSRLRAVETLVSTRSGQPKITSIALRYDGDAASRQTADSSKFTSRTTISPERRHSSYNEGEIKTRVDNVTSTFLEPAYKSQTSLFSPKAESTHESNITSFVERHDGYHARSQVYNSKDKLSLSEKLDCENRKELSLARMQPPAKLTTVTSEAPARTFSSAKSAFDKQQYNRRSSSPPSSSTSYSPSATRHQSQATSASSSSVLSSFERKVSNSSSSRRSQSPVTSDLTQQYSNLFSKRPTSPPPPPASQRLSASSEQITEAMTLSARRSSHEKLVNNESRHRDKETPGQDDSNSRVISTKVESEIGKVTRTASRSPNPTDKLTALSKNSPKDFIGRVRSESPVRQFSERSSGHNSKHVSSSKPASLKDITDSPIKSGSQSPIYQNRDVYHSDVTKASRQSERVSEVKLTECGLEAVETDSAILEELTRAADQILQAVNGYTDEDSRRASSDDDRVRRSKERRVLGTIVEAPTRKQSEERRDSLKMNGNSRRPQRTSSKTKLGPTSSTSSVESVSRETKRTPSKTSSRTARMVQRASSRELLLQANASSSEDIASGTESAKPRVPPPRRSRTSSSSTKTAQTSQSKSREKKTETTETSRTTKERSSVSRVKSRDATVSSQESRRKTPETKQYPVKEKTIPAVNSSMSGRERSSTSRTTTSRTKKSASSRHEGTSKTNK